MLALLFGLLLANIQLVFCSFLDLSSIKKPVKGPRIVNDIGSAEYRPIGTMNPEYVEPGTDNAPPPTTSLMHLASKLSARPAEPNLPAPKRTRKSVTAPDIELYMSAENIIDRELNSCAYHIPEKKRIFKEALEAIAANDIDKFDRIQDEFIAIFKLRSLKDFERFGIKDYLSRFMVLFGADKFFHTHGFGLNNSQDLVNMDIIKYLISTKPLDVVFNILLGFKRVISCTSEIGSEIESILKEKYPEMDFARKLALKLLNHDESYVSWSGDILSAKSELDAFKIVSSELKTYFSHPKVLYSLALERPDLYEQCNGAEKFQFIKAAISRDDVEIFEEILNLDLEMINYLHNNQSFRDAKYQHSNLMEICIDRNAIKCFTFLFEIVPELLNNPTNFPCTLGRILNDQNLIFLDFILSKGYNADSLVHDKDGKTYSIVQFAFLNNLTSVLTSFVPKFGEERIRSSIKVIFPNKESIIKHVIEQAVKSKESERIVDFMLDVLKINPTDKFSYQGKTGNILIFLNRDTIYLKARFLRP